MSEKWKRYIIRYTILLLIPVMACLPGCGNDADVDSAETIESVETMEKIESCGNSIKDDAVEIIQEEDEVAYELFPNDELTVAQTRLEMLEASDRIALYGRVLLEKPIVNWNGEAGELRYDWFKNILQVDEDAFLFASDCYFPEEKLQQRVIYLAQAPDFVPQEVFRQDSRAFDEEPYGGRPELLERRMPCPEHVEAGYVYEADGLLYCLDEEFKESVLLCNLRELMGESYLFSPWIPDENKCDVAADAARLLACTDEGLYEYNLESKEETLLEPAVLIPHEIEHIEGDCDCGETGFEFDGPIAAEYVPGELGYAFLTGSEYGGATGVTLRSAEGETLYQREIEGYIGDFRWIESGDAVNLAVFYRENGSAWMERVDVHTGEKEVFAVPDEVFWDNNLSVGFLDADHLIYCSKQVSEAGERDHTSKSKYDICALSDEEIKKPANAEDIDQQIIVFTGGYSKIIVKYRYK